MLGMCLLVDINTHLGFPGGSASKNSPADARDVGSILGSGRAPGEGNGNPLPWQRSLADYSPLVCKESDMTDNHHPPLIYLALLPKSANAESEQICGANFKQSPPAFSK